MCGKLHNFSVIQIYTLSISSFNRPDISMFLMY